MLKRPHLLKGETEAQTDEAASQRPPETLPKVHQGM